MTLSDLKERVRVYLDDQTATQFTNKLITEVANSIIRYLWQKVKSRNPDWAQKSTSITTSDNASSYALPADYGTPTFIEYADKTRLDPWRWPIDEPSASKGKPSKYRIMKGYVVLEPVPDGIYSLTFWYEMLIPELSADADVHGLPAYFDEVIIQKTALMLGAKIDRVMVGELERAMLSEIGVVVRESELKGIP